MDHAIEIEESPMAQSQLKDWAQLVRVPNTFTAAADPLAGLCIGSLSVSFDSHPISALLVALGSILLYWGGMVLNDVFDFPEDQKNQRPGPIVRGAISLEKARMVGWAMLAIGWFLACLAAYLIHSSITWTPLVGAMLVGAIIGYDGLLKNTVLAPALMGLCRALNLCLGMSVAAGDAFAKLPMELWLYPLAYGLYVMGFTIAARKEFLTQQSKTRLWAGWLTSLAGVFLFAWIIWRFPSPSLSNLIERRRGSSRWFFPLLMLLLSLPVFRRALVSIRSLQSPDLGLAIRTAIINILFIDAVLALIYKGPWHGLLLAMLILPTVYLARVFRST
jgi:4-hydroxybenzoate polyprenyltransferase